MTCEDTRTRLTAYLDGEVDGDRASAIRGHLRACDACRAVAHDEAAVRDGLRALAPIDPPASLWANVQRELAAAEVADAQKPAWRRTLSRLTQWVPLTPRFAVATAALAVAISVISWRSRHRDVELTSQPSAQPSAQLASHEPPVVTPTPPPTQPSAPPAANPLDVTAELAAAPARTTAGYSDAADELLHLAQEARVQWSDDRKRGFDTKVSDLRHAVEVAPEGRARQKAYRVLIRYLQNVTVRDDINERAYAGGGQ